MKRVAHTLHLVGRVSQSDLELLYILHADVPLAPQAPLALNLPPPLPSHGAAQGSPPSLAAPSHCLGSCGSATPYRRRRRRRAPRRVSLPIATTCTAWPRRSATRLASASWARRRPRDRLTHTLSTRVVHHVV